MDRSNELTTHMASPSTTFTFPASRTATRPAEARGLRRDGVRLLVASGAGIVHTTFDRIGQHLRPGDLLVVNNSATVAAEIDATAEQHGPVVLHLAARLEDLDFVVELRSAPDAAEPVLDAAVGEMVAVGRGVTLRLLAPYPGAGSSPTGSGNRLWRASASDPTALETVLAARGRPISYGYLHGRFDLAAYQTVFSLIPGSAEMPSAGRPFSDRLVTELVRSGTAVAPITLHTGVSSQEAGEGPQAEWFEVPPSTAALVNLTRSRGGRIVAVGTTVTRALESTVDADGRAQAASGWTEHVVTPERPPRLVDGLITGWHNPEASHLLLVEAIAGPAMTQRAYDAAVENDYLWHEFGDSALLLPTTTPDRSIGRRAYRNLIR
ncbi:S-adenosylmethionine:tRNA ribosyltransferase-isomerase [Nakamurella sp. UYEF19]|uniref:S-adenosylmethionine:tRNA ribosyltransferase-isomerase n=1 Tax=Nakamurella sp. UYEF19 TaxID=1756392 RepID=UPI003392BC1D